jgi:2-polyprenyl-3-methyl-5-hydroxy-6-metoxy-1,4-benzoquinol methylase
MLFVKRVLHKMGIDVRLVRKGASQSAIRMNEVEIVNSAWSDEKISRKFLTRQVLARIQESISILKKHAVDLEGKSVVDVGCGNGMLLKLLAENFILASQTGIEYAGAALEVAKRIYPGPVYVIHNINRPFPMKFDAVVCTEVLEHIEYPAKAMNNLVGMVNAGGVLFITVPNGRIDQYEGHINFWSPESWRVFISEHCGSGQAETGSGSGGHLLYALVRF